MRKHSTSRARMALLLASAAVLMLTLSVGAVSASAASKGQGQKPSKKQKRGKSKARKATAPVSGIYDACSVSEPKRTPLPDCADRLAVLHQGGFQVVLNYWTDSMSLEDNLIYAAQAEAQGMQVIWNLSNYRNEAPLGPKLDLVRATMSLPVTWGYYIGDEVRPEDRGAVAQLSAAVRGITRKPLMFVSRPNPSQLKPFRKLANYVGPDDYPYGPFDPPTCQTSRWATKITRNPVMVLQAYSWSIDFSNFQPYWPSAGQMRQMRNQATRCGDPKLLMWFCFHCITDYHPNPDDYWRQLAWAANGISLGPNPAMSTPAS